MTKTVKRSRRKRHRSMRKNTRIKRSRTQRVKRSKKRKNTRKKNYTNEIVQDGGSCFRCGGDPDEETWGIRVHAPGGGDQGPRFYDLTKRKFSPKAKEHLPINTIMYTPPNTRKRVLVDIIKESSGKAKNNTYIFLDKGGKQEVITHQELMDLQAKGATFETYYRGKKKFNKLLIDAELIESLPNKSKSRVKERKELIKNLYEKVVSQTAIFQSDPLKESVKEEYEEYEALNPTVSTSMVEVDLDMEPEPQAELDELLVPDTGQDVGVKDVSSKYKQPMAEAQVDAGDKWTPEQDALLLQLIRKEGPGDWQMKATKLPFARDGDELMRRWTEIEEQQSLATGGWTPGDERCAICWEKLYDPRRDEERCVAEWKSNMYNMLTKIFEENPLRLFDMARAVSMRPEDIKAARDDKLLVTNLINMMVDSTPTNENWYLRWKNKIDELQIQIDELSTPQPVREGMRRGQATRGRSEKKEILETKKRKMEEDLRELIVITLPCGHKLHRCCLEHPISTNDEKIMGRALTPNKSRLRVADNLGGLEIREPFGSTVWHLSKCPVCPEVIPQIVHLVLEGDKATDRKYEGLRKWTESPEHPQLRAFIAPNLSTLELTFTKKAGEALLDFDGRGEVEGHQISFKKGDKVMVMDSGDSEWSTGHVVKADGSTSETGLFPSSYVTSGSSGLIPMISKLKDNSIAHLHISTHGEKWAISEGDEVPMIGARVLASALKDKLRNKASILLDTCKSGKLNFSYGFFEQDQMPEGGAFRSPPKYSDSELSEKDLGELREMCEGEEAIDQAEVDSALEEEDARGALIKLLLGVRLPGQAKGRNYGLIYFSNFDPQIQGGFTSCFANTLAKGLKGHIVYAYANNTSSGKTDVLFRNDEETYRGTELGLDNPKAAVIDLIMDRVPPGAATSEKELTVLPLKELKAIAHDIYKIPLRTLDEATDVDGPGFVYFGQDQLMNAFIHTPLGLPRQKEYYYISPGTPSSPLSLSEFVSQEYLAG